MLQITIDANCSSTVIEGNKVAPGLGDRYLGKTGYKSQQTSQPEDPNRPNNLWQPVDEEHDHGAYGAFNTRARKKSWQLWADTHRGILTLVGTGIASIVAAVLLRREA